MPSGITVWGYQSLFHVSFINAIKAVLYGYLLQESGVVFRAVQSCGLRKVGRFNPLAVLSYYPVQV
jgi:hypothetical protein